MSKKQPANDPQETNKPSAAGDQAHKKRLDGYPGAALMVGADGAVAIHGGHVTGGQ